MLYFIAAAASARLEHGRHWMGLEGRRVGSLGAKESSASPPLRNVEIPGKALAVVLAEVAGTLIFV